MVKDFINNAKESPSDTKSPLRGVLSYRRLWRYSVFLTSVVALTPLIIMTIVHSHQYQKAVQTELIFPFSRLLSNTQRALQSVIDQRKSALKLLINQKTFQSITENDELKATFMNMKESFGGFVDLGMIDSEGNQFLYIGPYDLEGKNYKDQQWFHEVNLRDVYVSDVFMGHRNFPHFVIAVNYESLDGSRHVLRATLDMQLLQRQIEALDLGRAGDVFIINRRGIVQTDSRYHGNLLEASTVPVPNYSSQAEVIDDYFERGQSYILGYAYIENSPFILITVQDRKDLMKNWMVLKNDPVWFLIGSSVLILIVIFGSSTYMVKRIRTADEHRAKIVHNMEYTNKMASIGRLAASVAHEINNPLAIINEKSGLMKDIAKFTDNFPQKEKVIALVGSIQNSVDRCSTITHRLLGFARRMEYQKELIDLDILLKEVVGFLGKDVEHRNISIYFDFPDEMPTIESDRGQLQQVFLNIINNAVAAVKDDGWIRITIEEQEDETVSVTICDNGTGISKVEMKRLFEPFFSTKGQFGTGLGLSITYEIVQKLGGHIDVESELGEGTCFTITLPRTKI